MQQERDAAARLRIRIPAKINLHIGVGPRREDGYHELVTVMQTVSLHDTLRLRASEDGQAAHPSARRLMCLALTVDDSSNAHGAETLPVDERNLVVRAARALMDEMGIGAGRTIVVNPQDGTEVPCTHLHLTKRIPIAAGMGGGSADAAAALVRLEAELSAWLTDGGPMARPMPADDAPVSILPVPEPAPEPAPEPGATAPVEQSVTIVKVELVTSIGWTADGSMILMPHYRMTDSDGGWWSVLAVADRYVAR
jgi:hypothetical protein